MLKLFKRKKEKIITVYDVYKNLVRNTEVEIIENGTMKRLSIDEAKDRKLCLVVPRGELKLNIFCSK